jgi:hypothetical protein
MVVVLDPESAGNRIGKSEPHSRYKEPTRLQRLQQRIPYVLVVIGVQLLQRASELTRIQVAAKIHRSVGWSRDWPRHGTERLKAIADPIQRVSTVEHARAFEIRR